MFQRSPINDQAAAILKDLDTTMSRDAEIRDSFTKPLASVMTQTAIALSEDPRNEFLLQKVRRIGMYMKLSAQNSRGVLQLFAERAIEPEIMQRLYTEMCEDTKINSIILATYPEVNATDGSKK